MRLKCHQQKLTDEQVALVPTTKSESHGLWESKFDVEIGKEYVALGLYLQHGVLWVYVANEFNAIRVVPLCLFRILDGRLPSSWRISSNSECTVAFMAPPEASDLLFADRVDEMDPRALDVWRRIVKESSDRQ